MQVDMQNSIALRVTFTETYSFRETGEGVSADGGA